MDVLIGCEESQAVTIAFRERGFNAFSCDLLPCTGWHPDWHLQCDIFEAIRSRKWGFIGLHCPCTFTALSGNRHYHNSPLRIQGATFTKKCWFTACDVCDHVYLEQPKSVMQSYIGNRSQIIHPYQFGHGETKETWLWLKGLPMLMPTNIVPGREQRIWKMGRNVNRRELRSKTYPGIASAIADQWGNYLITHL